MNLPTRKAKVTRKVLFFLPFTYFIPRDQGFVQAPAGVPFCFSGVRPKAEELCSQSEQFFRQESRGDFHRGGLLGGDRRRQVPYPGVGTGVSRASEGLVLCWLRTTGSEMAQMWIVEW